VKWSTADLYDGANQEKTYLARCCSRKSSWCRTVDSSVYKLLSRSSLRS